MTITWAFYSIGNLKRYARCASCKFDLKHAKTEHDFSEWRFDMVKYRNELPQLSNGFFLTDGGIETTLVFHEGLDLPHFAAFHLLKDKKGEAARRWIYSGERDVCG